MRAQARCRTPSSELSPVVPARDNFLKTMDISVYSFTAIAQRAVPLMKNGGSMLTMTYHGADDRAGSAAAGQYVTDHGTCAGTDGGVLVLRRHVGATAHAERGAQDCGRGQ